MHAWNTVSQVADCLQAFAVKYSSFKSVARDVTSPYVLNCRQLTDEMNLELEQRRTDYAKRSQQLEDQSRYAVILKAQCIVELLQYFC